MSDIMLHSVLNMPPELWADSEIDRLQRHSRYKQASRKIEDLNSALLTLVNSNSDWSMCLSYDEIELIDNLILEAERM